MNHMYGVLELKRRPENLVNEFWTQQEEQISDDCTNQYRLLPSVLNTNESPNINAPIMSMLCPITYIGHVQDYKYITYENKSSGLESNLSNKW